MQKRYLKAIIIALALGFLILMTPNVNAIRFANEMQRPKVLTEYSTKTMEILGEKIDFERLSQVTYFSNGTMDVYFSITAENISDLAPRVKISYSRTVLPVSNETSGIFGTQSATRSSYEGPLQERPWDGLFSVLAPGNSTQWIKYDHDNNYWRYHPLEWNQQWEMEGLEKAHVHLASGDANAWKAGNLTDDQMMAKIVGGGSLAIRIVGIAAAAAIGYLAEGSLLGLIVAIIVGVLAQIFAWLIEVFGSSNHAQTIADRQSENDDIFLYYWGFRTIDVWGCAIDPPNFNRDTMQQYHKAEALIGDIREFYEAWGPERNTSSPGKYTTEIDYVTPPFNTGILYTGSS